jgi:cyclopropane fatty-acyl-phospholipid synthase-like methyltransferase
METENTSIHDLDFGLICEYFASMERQGPGSSSMTLKALSYVTDLSENSKILDLGCGTGSQTMVLAQNTLGQIMGIDLFEEFVNIFNANAEKLKLNHRVTAIVGSMDKLDFRPGEIDLIWSEGAIYNMGFERGLNYWVDFLKQGGYVALTEVAWLTIDRPAEIEDFWQDAYSEIDTIQNKIIVMQNAGFEIITTFVLPEACWLDNFYALHIKAQKQFLSKHPNNIAAQKLVENEKHEAMLYAKYKQYYGYVFFIGRKL